MKLITVVGAALLTVGAGGLISGLGGEYFFCIPVYDVANLQPGWGNKYECPSWSCAAWSSTVPDWSQDTATSGANRSLFLPRMWWLFPTVSMQSLGTVGLDDEQRCFGAFVCWLYQLYRHWRRSEWSPERRANDVAVQLFSGVPGHSVHRALTDSVRAVRRGRQHRAHLDGRDGLCSLHDWSFFLS